MLRRRWTGPERGSNLVEMALIVPLLLFLIAGMVDFSRAFQVYIVINNAAREGARQGVRLPCYDDDPMQRSHLYDKVIAAVVEEAGASNVTVADGDITMTPDLGPGCPGQEQPFTITVTKTYTPMLGPLFSIGHFNLTAIDLVSSTTMMAYGNDQMPSPPSP